MKKSFTLIEILISIIIFSMLFFAMFSVISQIKHSKNIIKEEFNKNKNTDILVKVLYNDILNALKIKIVKSPDSDFIRLYLQTVNSLYGYCKPYVIWYVSKNRNSLIRVENSEPITLDNENLYYLNKFAQNVKIFKIYKNKEKYFVYIGVKKPIYFEIYKGF